MPKENQEFILLTRTGQGYVCGGDDAIAAARKFCRDHGLARSEVAGVIAREFYAQPTDPKAPLVVLVGNQQKVAE